MPNLSELVRNRVAEIASASKSRIPEDYPGFGRDLAERAIEADKVRVVALRAELNELVETMHELGLLP